MWGSARAGGCKACLPSRTPLDMSTDSLDVPTCSWTALDISTISLGCFQTALDKSLDISADSLGKVSRQPWMGL